MQKSIEPLSVSTTTEGAIEIAQQQSPEEPQLIIITPEQVPLLIQWLQEAVAELKNGN